jgi:2-keto-3-deoxy-L-rhamnonate aldolase RhmA
VIDPVPGGALYSMLVDLTALDRMGTAQRIAARVCGVDVVLAGPAGRLARDLAIRAHEESSASQP